MFGKVRSSGSNGGYVSDYGIEISDNNNTTTGTTTGTVNSNCRAVIQKENVNRLVVVRYFLDRPGYDDTNSVARPWFNVPIPHVTPNDIQNFVIQQGIIDSSTTSTSTSDNANDTVLDDNNLLVEVYIDKFGSYMSLQACIDTEIEWNFINTTCTNPGFLLLRLTDTSNEDSTTNAIVSSSQQQQQQISNSNEHNIIQKVNATPIGLFAFSMVLGIHNAIVLIEMNQNSSNQINGLAFQLTYAPYAYWIGGFLQLITGIFELLRNNIYGGVAFTTFGCFWLANGTRELLLTYITVYLSTTVSRSTTSILDDVFNNTTNYIPYGTDVEYSIMNMYTAEPDKWGIFITEIYVFMFICVLLKQTFVMNKLSTIIIISLLCYQITSIVSIFGYKEAAYINIGFGFITSLLGFYLFTIEFTNIVYNKELLNVHKWNIDHSPDELFGAPGKFSTNTLLSKATKLRLASSTSTSALSHVNK